MEQLTAFFDMGGYAVFVWTAYALATTGIFGVWYMYRRTVRSRQAILDRLRPSREVDDKDAEPSKERDPQTREA